MELVLQTHSSTYVFIENKVFTGNASCLLDYYKNENATVSWVSWVSSYIYTAISLTRLFKGLVLSNDQSCDYDCFGFTLMFSYQVFSKDFYWKASLSLDLLCQGFQLSTRFTALWSPLHFWFRGVLLCSALGGLQWSIFPLKGWQRPLVIRHTGNLSPEETRTWKNTDTTLVF